MYKCNSDLKQFKTALIFDMAKRYWLHIRLRVVMLSRGHGLVSCKKGEKRGYPFTRIHLLDTYTNIPVKSYACMLMHSIDDIGGLDSIKYIISYFFSNA